MHLSVLASSVAAFSSSNESCVIAETLGHPSEWITSLSQPLLNICGLEQSRFWTELAVPKREAAYGVRCCSLSQGSKEVPLPHDEVAFQTDCSLPNRWVKESLPAYVASLVHQVTDPSMSILTQKIMLKEFAFYYIWAFIAASFYAPFFLFTFLSILLQCRGGITLLCNYSQTLADRSW